jgi:hypothetical protein
MMGFVVAAGRKKKFLALAAIILQVSGIYYPAPTKKPAVMIA